MPGPFEFTTGGETYYYNPGPVSPTAAQTACANHAGGPWQLVSLTGQAEEAAVWEQIPGCAGFWIGLSRLPSSDLENGWTWANGQPFGAYTGWGTNQPNNWGPGGRDTGQQFFVASRISGCTVTNCATCTVGRSW